MLHGIPQLRTAVLRHCLSEALPEPDAIQIIATLHVVMNHATSLFHDELAECHAEHDMLKHGMVGALGYLTIIGPGVSWASEKAESSTTITTSSRIWKAAVCDLMLRQIRIVANSRVLKTI